MEQSQIAQQNLKILRYQFLFWGWLPENVILIIYFGELLNSYALSGVVLLLRYFFISFFEIPTGIISDKYGRLLSLIFSALCYSFVKISYILAFFCYPFVFLIISSIFYGLAESLSSGTNNAVVYENVKKLKALDNFEDYYGKIKACHILGLALSSLLGGLVASIFSMYAVMWLSLFGTFLHLYFSWRLIETGFTPSSRKNFQQFWESCLYIWKNGKLNALFIAEVLNSAGSRGQADTMPIYLQTLIPFWAMGLWRFIGRSVNFCSSWFVQFFINRFGFKKCYIWSVISAPASILFGLILNNITTPIVFLADFFLHGIKYTSITKIKQNEFTDTQRATMESIYSMSSNIFAGITVLLISLVAQYTSAYWAIFASLILKLIAIPYYFMILRK